MGAHKTLKLHCNYGLDCNQKNSVKLYKRAICNYLIS